MTTPPIIADITDEWVVHDDDEHGSVKLRLVADISDVLQCTTDLLGIGSLLEACRQGTFYEDYDESLRMLAEAERAVLAIAARLRVTGERESSRRDLERYDRLFPLAERVVKVATAIADECRDTWTCDEDRFLDLDAALADYQNATGL